MQSKVSISVGVSDPVPAYRRGLIFALGEAGFDAETVADPEAWVAEDGRRAVLLTAKLPDDSGTIRKLVATNPELRVIVLLKDATPSAYREALSAGASGAISWDDDPEAVVDVLRAALRDHCLLPAEVVRTLVKTNGGCTAGPRVKPWEKKWLQMLADGATIAELAQEANYSEREVFRLLHGVYQKLGARSRVEAVVKAARAGLLD